MRTARTALAAAMLLLAVPGPAPAAPARTGTAPFEGLGAWVDIFDHALWRHPEATVESIAARGARTLYLQSASYRFPGPLRYPRAAGRFLEAAHDLGMDVVAWYVPDFANLRRDFRWSRAAIGFRSPSGQRFDGFALDIEVTAVGDPNLRADRLLRLSERIRTVAGSGYPLGAIVPAPLRSPSYWPVLPLRALAGIYDAVLPMAYWSFHVSGRGGTSRYISRSVQVVRREAGAGVPIHMIGGLAGGADGMEVRGFVDSVLAHHLIGASLYDAHTSGPEDWRELARVVPPPPKHPPVFRPWKDLGAYGNLPQGGQRMDRVTFVTGPVPGALGVDLEGFDVDPGEVMVRANGRRVAHLAPTVARAWGTRTSVALPDEALDDDHANEITFEHQGTPGVWGVREVTTTAGPIPVTDRRAHGPGPGGLLEADRVTYRFGGNGTAMVVSLQARGVAAGEVTIVVNGRSIGALGRSDHHWSPPRTLALPEVLLRPGQNLLTFDDVRAPGARGRWAVRMVWAGRARLG